MLGVGDNDDTPDEDVPSVIEAIDGVGDMHNLLQASKYISWKHFMCKQSKPKILLVCISG